MKKISVYVSLGGEGVADEVKVDGMGVVLCGVVLVLLHCGAVPVHFGVGVVLVHFGVGSYLCTVVWGLCSCTDGVRLCLCTVGWEVAGVVRGCALAIAGCC